jgi:transposase
VARGDLTDAQWAVLEGLLPKGKKPGRPPIWSRRQPIDGIRFRVRTGIPWQDMPAKYGPWGRVYAPPPCEDPFTSACTETLHPWPGNQEKERQETEAAQAAHRASRWLFRFRA